MRGRRQRRGVRRGPETWRALVAEQAESGLTQRAFCQSRGLLLSTFCNAKRRIQATEPVANADKVEEFIAVALDGESVRDTSQGWDIELTLGDNMTLRVRRL